MLKVKKILVVSRMSAYCREAAAYGISLARQYGAELYFVHCSHDPSDVTKGPSVPLWVVGEDHKKQIVRNKQEIDAIIAAEKERGLRITELIKDADPVLVITEAVRDEKIDLVVMACHEEGRLEHVLYGRCTDAIVRTMPCSVLLVKQEPAVSGKVDY